MRVFDKEWFRLHQMKLLILLNHPLTRRWFRRIIGTKTRKLIVEIRPDSFTVFVEELGGGEILVRSYFFSREPFAKKLRQSLQLRPVWNTFHFWDWLIADRFNLPRFSFGFGTLTASPASGHAGTTMDGYVYRSGDDTFTNLRSGAGNGATDEDASFNSYYLVASTTSNQYAQLGRVILTFDTTLSLGSSQGVGEIILSLYGLASLNFLLGACSICVVGASPASNGSLVSGDYGRLGSTLFGSITSTNWTSANAYNAIPLTSTSTIINTAGITGLGLVSSWDFDNSFTGVWASSQGNNAPFNFADNGSNIPTLRVDYSTKGRIAAGYGLVRGFGGTS